MPTSYDSEKMSIVMSGHETCKYGKKIERKNSWARECIFSSHRPQKSMKNKRINIKEEKFRILLENWSRYRSEEISPRVKGTQESLTGSLWWLTSVHQIEYDQDDACRYQDFLGASGQQHLHAMMCLGRGRKFTGRGRAECYIDVFEALSTWRSTWVFSSRGWGVGGS